MAGRRRGLPKVLAPVLALGLLVGACSGGILSKAPPVTYNLTAPNAFPGVSRRSRGQMVVAEPTAIAIYDSEKIVLRPGTHELGYLGGAQWDDRLPKLLQARLVEAFENASRLRSVGRAGDRMTADFQLICDIRAFHIAAGEHASAEIAIAAKIVHDRSGRVMAARVFTARVPAEGARGDAAVAALNAAFRQVAKDMVVWASRRI